MKKVILLLGVLLLFAVTGCGGGGGNGANQGTVTTILVNPGSASVVVSGGTQRFSATALNENGATMSGVNFTWTTNAPSNVGAISSDGLFTAGSQLGGPYTVTCTANGKSQTAQVKVGQLKDAGTQFVDDIISTGDSAGTIADPRVDTIFSNTNNQVAPNMSYSTGALDMSTSLGFDLYLYSYLFTQTPGSISLSSLRTKGLASKGTTTLYTGTWTITYTEGTTVWTIVYTRSTTGSGTSQTDTVTVRMTNNQDAVLVYNGTVTYPTQDLKDIVYGTSTTLDEYTSQFNCTFVDSHLYTSTFTGSVTTNYVNETCVCSGAFNFKFKNAGNNYLKFTGDIHYYHESGQEDYLTGTLETANIKIDGSIRFTQVTNSHYDTGMFPSALSISGSIAENSSDPVKIEGSTTITIANAATFNPHLNYSASNYLQSSIVFDGSIQANNANGFRRTITYQQVGYQLYKMIRSISITSGGVTRTLSFTFRNTDATHLNVVIDSSWGPAKLDMTFAFDGSGIWSDPQNADMGDLTVNGTKKADIYRNNNGFKIRYTDGTFVEFL